MYQNIDREDIDIKHNFLIIKYRTLYIKNYERFIYAYIIIFFQSNYQIPNKSLIANRMIPRTNENEPKKPTILQDVKIPDNCANG